MRANQVLQNVADEMEAVIRAEPQAAPEPPVGSYIGRETVRQVELSKRDAALRKKAPSGTNGNFCAVLDAPDHEILKRCKPHFRPRETFRGFIARIAIAPSQIQAMADDELSRIVKIREEGEIENPPVPITYMPSASSKPQPASRFLATGGLGERE